MTLSPDYKQLLDNLTTAVILLDPTLRIVHINMACESLLQTSLEQVAGNIFDDYLLESSHAADKMRLSLGSDEQYTKRKTHWHLHNGKHITVDYTVTPLSDQQCILLEVQAVDRLLRISRDEALLASQETTRNLIRGLAHEVKNPLGGIRGAAQLLDRKLPTEELKEYTNIIMAEADRLRNLVDRMLGPRQPIAYSNLNIHEVLERVLVLIKAETAGKIDLQRQYDPSIPEVSGDLELLIQAVLNVVRNATQALNSQTDNLSPRITLRTGIKRQFTIGREYHPLVAHISIEDNGPGIPQNLMNDIFYPMISGRAQGTGLGLAISQQLINQHRGLIECKSKPGETLFFIYIPLEHNT